jgi:hypothetical protein
LILLVTRLVSISGGSTAQEPGAGAPDLSPRREEQQLPLAMHAKMQQLPRITVGQTDGDLQGRDHRVLQAAVEYIAALGGGTVEIGPGEYLMRDSLHLRSHVTVRGTSGKTILRKADSVMSPLALDGDFGEQQITVEDPQGFEVGFGVAIRDDRSGGFHTTVARITGRSGNTFSIDQPLMADCMVAQKAQAATVFPVVSGREIQGARIENLVIEGNRSANAQLNGCRGAGIYLYRGFGTVIQDCTVRNYHGDGISFQQSNDVSVLGCTSEGNAELGLHPGSGSQRPTIRNCIARGNGTDGLFLCWRVRHGLFEDNVLEQNGRFGISIGHKDSDNLLQRNHVRRNQSHGVFFRDELPGMAAHRNHLKDNLIEDNGEKPGTAAIRIRGATNDLIFEGNTIRDTRPSREQTQSVGIQIEERVGQVTLRENQIEARKPVDDRRTAMPQ